MIDFIKNKEDAKVYDLCSRLRKEKDLESLEKLCTLEEISNGLCFKLLNFRIPEAKLEKNAKVRLLDHIILNRNLKNSLSWYLTKSQALRFGAMIEKDYKNHQIELDLIKKIFSEHKIALDYWTNTSLLDFGACTGEKGAVIMNLLNPMKATYYCVDGSPYYVNLSYERFARMFGADFSNSFDLVNYFEDPENFKKEEKKKLEKKMEENLKSYTQKKSNLDLSVIDLQLINNDLETYLFPYEKNDYYSNITNNNLKSKPKTLEQYLDYYISSPQKYQMYNPISKEELSKRIRREGDFANSQDCLFLPFVGDLLDKEFLLTLGGICHVLGKGIYDYDNFDFSSDFLHLFLGQTLGNFSNGDRKYLMNNFYAMAKKRDSVLIGVELRPDLNSPYHREECNKIVTEQGYDKGYRFLDSTLDLMGVDPRQMKYSTEYVFEDSKELINLGFEVNSVAMWYECLDDIIFTDGEREVKFEKGEIIPAASSYKFSPGDLLEDGSYGPSELEKYCTDAGFTVEALEVHSNDQGRPDYMMLLVKK